jgi:exodeoxyribonuclease VII large subunit
MAGFSLNFPQAEQVYSVAELLSGLRDCLEENFGWVWVRGEVGNFVKARSQHWYFTLREGNSAQLRAVMYRGNNLRCRFTPQDGMEVLAGGQMSVYEPWGEMQLVVLRLEPVGLGAIELQRRVLLDKLRAKGYLDASRKRPLPRYPRRIGVVTSLSGAALWDMVEQFAQRWPLLELVVRHSAVQGPEAVEQLVAALEELGRLHRSGRLPLDIIIVARGGGSSEDLAAFDAEAVAEAIVRSPVPVISAVGHEIDVTIADLVADVRAETPSAAVHRAVPHRQDKLQQVYDYRRQLQWAMMARLESWQQRLQQLRDHSAWLQPGRLLATQQQRLDEWSGRLTRAADRQVAWWRHRCQALAARLHNLNPRYVLQRGYSITLTEDGQLVRTVAPLYLGQRVRTYLAQGSFDSTVTSVAERGS